MISGKINEPISDSTKGSWSQIWLDLVRKNYILNEDIEIVISTLITLAFSNGFNKILKSLYIK